jgi:hypothetical protein
VSITDKTRKMLWGLSGNRCAVCRQELVHPDDRTGEHAVIGDEHHIHPQRDSGSDEYRNLILLCPNHHRLVESRPTEYPQQQLRELKRRHEAWVRQRLAPDIPKEGERPLSASGTPVLPRIKSGKQLAAVFFGVDLNSFDEDEPLTPEERDSVAGLFSLLEEWDFIYDEMPYADRMSVAGYLEDQIQTLEAMDLWVFAGRVTEHMAIPYGNNQRLEDDWAVAYVHVRRKENPNISREKSR